MGRSLPFRFVKLCVDLINRINFIGGDCGRNKCDVDMEDKLCRLLSTATIVTFSSTARGSGVNIMSLLAVGSRCEWRSHMGSGDSGPVKCFDVQVRALGVVLCMVCQIVVVYVWKSRWDSRAEPTELRMECGI